MSFPDAQSIQDSEVVEACQGGDWAAFELLVNKYKNGMYHFAWKVTGDAELAKDITQDAFIKVFKNLRGFQGRARFSTWLYRIVYNLCMDELRFLGRKELELEGIKGRLSLASGEESPAQKLLADEIHGALRNAIEELAPPYKAVLLLADCEGLSYREIAVIVNCKIGLVKWRLHTARRIVRQKIAPYLTGAKGRKSYAEIKE